MEGGRGGMLRKKERGWMVFAVPERAIFETMNHRQKNECYGEELLGASKILVKRL